MIDFILNIVKVLLLIVDGAFLAVTGLWLSADFTVWYRREYPASDYRLAGTLLLVTYYAAIVIFRYVR